MDLVLFYYTLYLAILVTNGTNLKKQEYIWVEDGKTFEGLSKQWTSETNDLGCTSSTAMIAKCSAGG